jgi:gas vesicle protein
MIRLASWLLGFSIGAALGAVVVMVFVPQTSAEIRYRLRSGYQETMQAARLASETRRRELEAELARKQGYALPPPRRS